MAPPDQPDPEHAGIRQRPRSQGLIPDDDPTPSWRRTDGLPSLVIPARKDTSPSRMDGGPALGQEPLTRSSSQARSPNGVARWAMVGSGGLSGRVIHFSRLEAALSTALRSDAGQVMDAKLMAMSSVSFSSLCFTSKPLQSLLTRRTFRALLFIIGLWYAAMAVSLAYLHMHHGDGLAEVASLRVVVKHAQCGGKLKAGPMLHGQALPRWMVEHDRRDVAAQGADEEEVMTLHFRDMVVLNGVWVEGCKGTTAEGKVSVFGTAEKGSMMWHPVPLSAFRDTELLLSSCELREAPGGGDWVFVDWNKSWERLPTIGQFILFGLGHFGAIFCSLTARYNGARQVLAWNNLMMLLWGFTFAINDVINGRLNSFQLCVTMLKSVFFALNALAAFREEHFFALSLAAGSVHLLRVGAFGYHVWAHGVEAGSNALTLSRLGVGLFQGSWVLVLLIMNMRVKNQCRVLAQPDKKTYDDIWEDVGSKEGEILYTLKELVQSMNSTRGGKFKNKIPRQLKMDGTPVQSLDHLYAQAAVVEWLLRDKVWQWGKIHRGMFHSHSTKGVLLRASNPEFSSVDVAWPGVKGVKRAVEKVARRYKDDASYLVDIARNSIIFECIQDICVCIQTICSDKDVVVERIKNRMDPDYDTELSAGYRDVCINLRIATEWTEHMGVSTHVCEVQLLLTRIAKNKTEQGHRRYVQQETARVSKNT
eukprot:CAMPEP_0173379784 /NCGR_PEP_ID=MMETSP1356-20130122/2596_1 /TAXON_ID=77927 ORGANISM="Hemiselmis virescens, Strain PCC157" /NCGR_SAMPLE_ID=MMETSP1356 /ASSEMBLY_ACC=CAM_ASM_000847 /LENGTH=703 /DNA_ID=CAMNT_0014333185 /DNA_START=14 /DNA_END=2122 /DNA_ORIENTATION=+